jgi:hypothetical protein
MNIQECACGREPSLEKVSCDERKIWRVRCSCGMMSRPFVEGEDGTEQDCKDKAIAYWNFS